MITEELLSTLWCPSCHGAELKPVARGRDGALRCDGCQAGYPIRSGFPILLPDEVLGLADMNGPSDGPDPLRGQKETSRGSRWIPERLGRARNALLTQGVGPFMDKARHALRTEAERRLPALRSGPRFTCPCCGSTETFLTNRGRPSAQCPNCRAKERDRLLVLALTEVIRLRGSFRAVLHVAPEARVRAFLAPRVETYVATDLTRGVSSYAGELSAAADLTRLPFRPESFDLVLASHVLEHIPDDRAAVREIHRVLRPGGIALLPVPITHGGPTIEYDAPHPHEEMHVRAPGLDYFRRFEESGFAVVVRRSSDYPWEHQPYSYHNHRAAGAKKGMAFGLPGAVGQEQYMPVCVKEGGPETAVPGWGAAADPMTTEGPPMVAGH